MSNGRGSARHADFIGVSRKVADSPAFKDLPPIARALYVDLRRQYNGHNNGQIAAVLKGTEDRPGLAAFGWPPRSVFKILNILLEHGLIERTRQGGINYLSKTCSLYAFTDLPVVANSEKGVGGSMPSLAYLNFTPKDPVRRTRRKKVLDARGAYIDARDARTQVHAMPINPPISARGASSDLPSKTTQLHDTTAISCDSAMKYAQSPQVHAVHTLITLAIPEAGSNGDPLAVDPDVEPALKEEKARAQPKKVVGREGEAKSTTPTTCQAEGCETLTLRHPFCGKHRCAPRADLERLENAIH